MIFAMRLSAKLRRLVGKVVGSIAPLLAAAAGILAFPDALAVPACVTEPAGAIAWYRAENNANDTRGSNHGTNLGTYAAGHVGQAFSFNGTSGYVSVPDSATLEPASITVEAWVNFPSSPLPSLAMIVSKPVNTGFPNSYQIYFQAGKIVAEISDGGSTRPRAEALWSPVTGAWHHVALTFNDATKTLKAYVDGVEVASTVTGIPIAYGTATNPLLIGAEEDGSGPVYLFPGLIDEVTLYSRALSGAEIAAISGAGALGKCAPTLVTHTSDSGYNSLREAINYANTHCTIGPHSISFDIPGAGPHTIIPLTELDPLACNASINGYSQSGAAANTDTGGANNANIQVIINGSGCTGCNGLVVSGSTVTIKGLAIHSFSGTGKAGIRIAGGTANIYGNYLGTDDVGSMALGNGYGILVDSGSATIGYPGDANLRNLVTGNLQGGIWVGAAAPCPSAASWEPASGPKANKVAGAFAEIYNNLIGGTRGGLDTVFNAGPGIHHSNGAGCSYPEIHQNVIRFNSGDGIYVASGGDMSIASNSIYSNGGKGVVVASGESILITGNAIYSNAGPGIDLGNDEVTANDYIGTGTPLCTIETGHDCDSGANRLANHPVILSAIRVGGNTFVDYEMKGPPNSWVMIEFFDNPAAPATPSGRVPLGASEIVQLDGNGYFRPGTPPLISGELTYVSATASLGTCSECFDVTSEFSPAIAAVPPPSPVVTVFLPPTAAFGSPVPMTVAVARTASDPTYSSISASITLPGVPGAATVANPSNYVRGCGANGGSATAGGTSISASGGSWASNGSCALISVSLSFPAPGTYTVSIAPGNFSYIANVFGTLIGASNTSAITATITITSPAVFSLGTPSLAFGNQEVGTQSAPQSATINNTGTGNLVISSITGPAAFPVTGCSPLPFTIAAGGSCTLSVRFAPSAAGAQSGSILIASNASGSPHSLGVSGSGTVPAFAGVSIAPSPAPFGSVVVGSSSTLGLTVTNTGNATLNVTAITPSGTGFTTTSNCVGLFVTPGQTCQISVTFAPTTSGAHTGSVSVSSNAPGSPHTVALSGTGVAPAVSLSRGALAFGFQTVNTSSLAQAVTVTNTGSAPLGISAVTVAGDFGFTGCASPLTLSPGASCALSIYFFPTATGNRTGSVSIASNASGSPHVIGLSGTGTPLPVPGIALAPSSANFGTIVAGQSASQVLALSNPGTANLDIGSIQVVEPQPAAMRAKAPSFSQANDCPAALAPSAACNITVTYAPAVAGSHVGELHIVSNAAPSPLVASLSGSATPATTPGLQLSASSLTFAPQFPNTTSAAQSVTLTSSGTAPLVITQVAASGDFSFSGCGPSTLAPGATCSFAITFKPFSEGPHTGDIVITSNAPGSPHTLSLSGTGSPRLAPEISLSPSAFAFGSVRTQRTVTLTSRLTNAGAAALEISQISSAGSFFAQANNCPSSLAIGAFCDITVTYAPTATGPHSGQLVIHSNALPSPYIAAISGTGIAVPPPFLSVAGALDFGQQVSGVTVRRTLTLANTGGDPLTISQVTLIGSGAFGLEGACATIAPEGSCDLTVTFTPMGLAPFSARLDIVSNHPGGVVQVSLSGIGTALPRPALELSVGALGFGTQGVGSTTASRSVRLTSVGTVAAHIGSIAASLPDFLVDANQCPAVLAPQQGCDIGVAFRPVAPGGRQGLLVIRSDAAAEGGQPHSVSLIGVGCRFFTIGGSRNPQRLCSP